MNPLKLHEGFLSVKGAIYTGYIRKYFKVVGKDTTFQPSFRHLLGTQYITVGSNCHFREKTKLTAWDKYLSQTFKPEISIGNDCNIGAYSHITAINRITIGNNVSMGDFVLITDNSHGSPDNISEFNLNISKKTVYSRGPVILEDNIWVGEHSCILPGVTVGRGSVIGAGSVIRQSVPPYAIVVGNPAKVVGFLYRPQDIHEQEARIYPAEKRIPLEILEKNYQKYFYDRVKEINTFLRR